MLAEVAGWHSRCGFVSLASAICFRFAGVAPVRGGTYFSLLRQGDFLRGARQRKVGKRKPLTPSVLTLTHGRSTSPFLTPQRSGSSSLPALRISASPASSTSSMAYPSALPTPICGKRCVGFRAAKHAVLATKHSVRRRLWCDSRHTVCRKGAVMVC